MKPDERISALEVFHPSIDSESTFKFQEEYNLSYLFIAHDLSAVRHFSDRIAVIYLGRLVEVADYDKLYSSPQHTIPNPVVERKRERILRPTGSMSLGLDECGAGTSELDNDSKYPLARATSWHGRAVNGLILIDHACGIL